MEIVAAQIWSTVLTNDGTVALEASNVVLSDEQSVLMTDEELLGAEVDDKEEAGLDKKASFSPEPTTAPEPVDLISSFILFASIIQRSPASSSSGNGPTSCKSLSC